MSFPLMLNNCHRHDVFKSSQTGLSIAFGYLEFCLTLFGMLFLNMHNQVKLDLWIRLHINQENWIEIKLHSLEVSHCWRWTLIVVLCKRHSYRSGLLNLLNLKWPCIGYKEQKNDLLFNLPVGLWFIFIRESVLLYYSIDLLRYCKSLNLMFSRRCAVIYIYIFKKIIESHIF